MPWFPEFSTAIELSRRDARARGQADPVMQYLKALDDGGAGALERAWPGEVVVHDPRAGEVRGHHDLRAFIRDNKAWMAAHQSRISVVGSITVGSRAVVELLAHVLHEGSEVAWPVAVVADSMDERSIDFRTYCSQWPVDGRRHPRAPILPAAPVETPGVVGRYVEALAAGDTESVVKTFAPDAYVQEAIGPDNVHRGTSELQAYYSARGREDLRPCATADDGTSCALEYNLVGRGEPQAGLAVFERGTDGLLAAVRLYDDIE
ncbi:nuclear transport factor 2 family protein [Kribbella sp. NPDC026611]|uniref:nuclear transport factor 2 family protein n=1 Tax=Kribbella sp. NPDC026611 TaxID=3154911 RepID=UPI0033C0EE83